MSEYYSEHTVRGRATYTCHFCRRAIERGALHVTVSMGRKGDRHFHRAHLECHEAATGQPAPAHASASRQPTPL